MRSIQLILASLSVAAQLSGVQSEGDAGNRRKDQLRGGGRAQAENIKEVDAENISNKVGRDLQKAVSEADMMTWDDQGYGDDGANYDDYFSLPADMAYTGNTADDNFFTAYDNTDMGYTYDSVSNSQSNQYDDYAGDDTVEDDYFTSDNQGRYGAVGVTTHSGHNKNVKSFKSKSDKKGGLGSRIGKFQKSVPKHSKSKSKSNGPKVKDHRSRSSMNAVDKAISNRYDVQYDDTTGMDDFFSFQPVDNSLTYNDNHQSSSVGGQGAWSSGHDDFFESSDSSNTRSYQTSSNQGRSGNTGSAMSYYDDDDDAFLRNDKPIYFIPRPFVILEGSLYSDNRARSVTPDNTEDVRTLGTEYLWDQALSDALNINSNLIPIRVDNEIVHFYFVIDGYCIRIGPPDQNSVQGYCFFTYTAVDPNTNLVSGSFTAQGIIVNAIVPGQLTVSGGTGVMTGALGLVEILPAELDENFFPPVLIQPQVNEDPFDQVAGWAHYFEITVDVLFFLPELYAPPRSN